MANIPKILSEIPAAPEQFFISGSNLENDFIGIGIVGTRKASAEGLIIAEEFAHALASANIPIISGLAFGIDSAAHKGCLAAGGRTIAVLAGGIKNIYPATNAYLAKQIISSGGSLVSEYEDEPSYPDLFLKRNRIISGLSQAVVIIEAPLKSGAMSTANWAAEQGRDVFVVPGPISNPNYRGSHALIRDGARLITHPDEILSDLGIAKPNIQPPQTNNFSGDSSVIFNLLSSSSRAIPIDKIIAVTKLEPQIVLSVLTELTLAGKITEVPTGYIGRQ